MRREKNNNYWGQEEVFEQTNIKKKQSDLLEEREENFHI